MWASGGNGDVDFLNALAFVSCLALSSCCMGYLLLANSYEKQHKKNKNKKKGNVVVLDIFLFTSRDCVGFNANANCRWSILKRPHTIHNESRLKWNFDAIRFDWPSCFFFLFPIAWHLLKDRGKCVLSVRKRIWYFPFSRCMHISFVRQTPRDGYLLYDIDIKVDTICDSTRYVPHLAIVPSPLVLIS